MGKSLQKYLGILLSGTISFANVAFAETNATECFQFQKTDTPAAVDLSLITDAAPLQKWCYQKKNFGTEKAVFIFNADSEVVKPELSALVWLDQNDQPRSMSVGSLSHGKISFQMLPDLSLNPFPIPLHPVQARALLLANRSSSENLASEAMTNMATNNESLTEEVSNRHWLFARPTDPATIQEGDFNFSVSEANTPFNGFWWSNEGVPMASGPTSPLGVYDASTAARTGTNPRSVVWEQAHHSDTSASWGGHCNGWAASTALYAEPTQTLYDPLTHTMVTPYAQKGMLAEASFCVNDAFYGKRYTGPADDLYDIHPDLFHKTLVHYIQTMGKTVAMDYERGVDIDNNVITGYRFHIVKTGTFLGSMTFHVDAVLTVAQYDVNQADSIGKAGTYEKPYSYTLTTDAQGNITTGKWDATSDNPDFMWVPLSPSENCSPRNPQVSPAQVSQLFAAFTPARAAWLPLNFDINATMNPQDNVDIPLSIPAGDHLQLHVSVRSIQPNANPGVVLIASGSARYPITGGEKYSMFIALPNGDSVLPLDQLLSIDSIAVVNQSATLSSNVDLTVQGLEYLAP